MIILFMYFGSDGTTLKDDLTCQNVSAWMVWQLALVQCRSRRGESAGLVKQQI